MGERAMTEDPGWRAREAKGLGEAIRTVLRRMDLDSRGWQEHLTREWTNIAGATVAAHSRPGRMERDALVVFVDSSVWLEELARRGHRALLQSILRQPNTTAIKRLMFRLDPDPRR